jgi:hypothetical protein
MLLVDSEFVSPRQANDLVSAFKKVVSMPAPTEDNGSYQHSARMQQMPARTAIDGLFFRRVGMLEVDRQLAQIRQQALDAVCQFYDVPGACYNEFTLVTEMRIGDAHPLHADNVKPSSDGRWVPNHTHWRDYTAMLYLNTNGLDYEGGLLRFPSIGQEVAPRAGMLVGFPCGRQYQHEVSTVHRGCRYSVSMWMTRDPSYAERWD